MMGKLNAGTKEALFVLGALTVAFVVGIAVLAVWLSGEGGAAPAAVPARKGGVRRRGLGLVPRARGRRWDGDDRPEPRRLEVAARARDRPGDERQERDAGVRRVVHRAADPRRRRLRRPGHLR